jgi:hypothetical protein
VRPVLLNEELTGRQGILNLLAACQEGHRARLALSSRTAQIFFESTRSGEVRVADRFCFVVCALEQFVLVIPVNLAGLALHIPSNANPTSLCWVVFPPVTNVLEALTSKSCRALLNTVESCPDFPVARTPAVRVEQL